MEHVWGVVEGLAVAAIVGGFAWLIQLRNDIDSAFEKIRNLEAEENNQKDHSSHN